MSGQEVTERLVDSRRADASIGSTQHETQHAGKADFLHPVSHEGRNGREGTIMVAIITRLLITVGVLGAVAGAPRLAPATAGVLPADIVAK